MNDLVIVDQTNVTFGDKSFEQHKIFAKQQLDNERSVKEKNFSKNSCFIHVLLNACLLMVT